MFSCGSPVIYCWAQIWHNHSCRGMSFELWLLKVQKSRISSVFSPIGRQICQHSIPFLWQINLCAAMIFFGASRLSVLITLLCFASLVKRLSCCACGIVILCWENKSQCVIASYQKQLCVKRLQSYEHLMELLVIIFLCVCSYISNPCIIDFSLSLHARSGVVFSLLHYYKSFSCHSACLVIHKRPGWRKNLYFHSICYAGSGRTKTVYLSTCLHFLLLIVLQQQQCAPISMLL